MAKPTFTLRAGEQFFAEKVSADCWKMPQVIGKRQVSGKVYMTDQRVAFWPPVWLARRPSAGRSR